MTVFESLLNHDFTVERRRRSPDGQGGWAIDYVEQDTVRGRIRPTASRNQEREVADREERQITHVFYCNADEDIRRGDRLTGTSPISGTTLVVEVDAMREPSLAGKHLEFDCNEKQMEVSTPEVGS